MAKLSLYFLQLISIKKGQKTKYKTWRYRNQTAFQINYLGCMLNEIMSEETMVLSLINKINNKLKFLYWKNRFLNPAL